MNKSNLVPKGANSSFESDQGWMVYGARRPIPPVLILVRIAITGLTDLPQKFGKLGAKPEWASLAKAKSIWPRLVIRDLPAMTWIASRTRALKVARGLSRDEPNELCVAVLVA
jgi:hypothetical protein